MTDENSKEYKFGNEKFGGAIRPGELELKFPEELTMNEFEDMFKERIEALQKFSRDINPFEEETNTKKEKLKPLSIRVKNHTKEFFKNYSILSAREVLELYEDFNNGSEAFINSLMEEEKNLEMEMLVIQEKLHNARLFREKLEDLNLKVPVKDEDRIVIIKENFPDSEVKIAESGEDIISDIELYNTSNVVMYNDDYLEITTQNDLTPVVYYFEVALDENEVAEITKAVEDYCASKEIEYLQAEVSIFDKKDEE